MDNPLIIASWPNAILHIDGDAFFASCEQALHPEYKGKPVVTGRERGIAASFSYEAKEKGVTRGMRCDKILKLCPDCIFVPSDYEAYSLISKRMFEIVKRYSPCVEEYSIDEGFVDLTGLRRPLNISYEKMAEKIKRDVESALGISVSVGVSLSKSLAKLASERDKPGGLVVIQGNRIVKLLSDVPLHKIWGIGHSTSSFLKKYGIKTALDFARLEEEFIKEKLTKPGHEIWQELRGKYIYKVNPKEKTSYQSISKTKTFTPATNNKNFVYAMLVKNMEAACIKARRYKLCSNRIVVFLKKQDFNMEGAQVKLTRGTSLDIELMPHVKWIFEKLFNKRFTYRATGVVLCGLDSEDKVQYSLFDDPIKIEKYKSVFHTVDELSVKYGKYTVHLGALLPAKYKLQHRGDRGDVPFRQKVKIKGETVRKRLNIPYFSV